jgi:hypothetical protein
LYLSFWWRPLSRLCSPASANSGSSASGIPCLLPRKIWTIPARHGGVTVALPGCGATLRSSLRCVTLFDSY